MSASPVALLSPSAKRSLAGLALVHAVRAVSLVLIAETLTRMIVGAVRGDDSWQGAVATGIVGVILGAGSVWASRAIAQRASLRGKAELRRALAQRLIAGDIGAGGTRGLGSTGSMSVLGTRGLDDLDAYFVTFLPALVSALVVPIVVGARIFVADWPSAVIIACTVPLVPLFMILIGKHTRAEVERASDALLRLSHHLVELARGLPVLVGLGRLREQSLSLMQLSDQHRERTMRTLKTAFLSSLALELIATISVAVVAVVIGVRLVYGAMELEAGLLVLLLASECFTPFRAAGAAYHASEDGVAALERARAIIDSPSATPLWADAPGDTCDSRVEVHEIWVRYPDRAPAVRGLSFVAPRGVPTLLDGESGAGKSSVLAVLAGRIGLQSGDAPEGARATGRITGVDAQGIAWVPQHPSLTGPSVLDELVLHELRPDPDAPVHARLAVLDELGIRHLADAAVGALSPGEARRVALARTLRRVDGGASVLLLDEPTAHLDTDAAALARAAISRRVQAVSTVVASHDVAMQALCEARVKIAPDATASPGMLAGAGRSAEPAAHSAGEPGEALHANPTHAAPTDAEPTHAAQPPSLVGSATLLGSILRPVRAAFLFAALLGVLAVASGITQTALSGWLIVRAAEQPPILMLTVAFVGVRGFGLGRSVLRYAERLQVHSAVLRAAGLLRLRLWDATATAGLSVKRLRTTGGALELLVGDVDRVRDQLPRLVLPPLAAAGATILIIGAAIWLLPVAVPSLVAMAVVTLLVAPWLAIVAERDATRREQALRSSLARRFSSILENRRELAVHRVSDGPLGKLETLEAQASAAARRGAVSQGLGHAVVTLATGLSAMLIVLIGADAGADAKLLAAFAFATLALTEPLADAVGAAGRSGAVRGSLAEVSAPLALAAEQVKAPETASDRASPAIHGGASALELVDVTAWWPESPAPVFEGMSLTVERGDWLTVTGPSGSGKTTLLALALGHLRPFRGFVTLGGRVARPDCGTVAWCPQEAHIFDSTLAANLALARRERPSENEMLDALARVGLADWAAALPEGLATSVGSAGSALSGGQRARVAAARTLLAHSPVVLLDEPTAHLDADSAAQLMRDLRLAFQDRAVVFVTHDDSAIAVTDARLTLGEQCPVRAPLAKR